jgi:hypothetical protein
MSSRSSKRSGKNKNKSSNASDAGSVKEFMERDADDESQQVGGTTSEPTSAETKAVPDSSVADISRIPQQSDSDELRKASPTSSVYGEVFKEDPPAVQVAILEPEIAVANPQPFPQEPIPLQENAASPNAESGWFSSLFACCVSRK